MPVNIHGKKYITVAERLEMAKDNIQEIYTEVMSYDPVIIVRATVTLKDGRKATGMSGANPSKAIEKSAPVEVAETSALGRCLGMLSYGAVEGIATADEIKKIDINDELPPEPSPEDIVHIDPEPTQPSASLGKCVKCGQPNYKSLKGNIVCSAKCWLK